MINDSDQKIEKAMPKQDEQSLVFISSKKSSISLKKSSKYKHISKKLKFFFNYFFIF